MDASDLSTLRKTPSARSLSLSNHPVIKYPLTKHHEFYFEDRMAVFQVQSTLFKVHRYFLSRQSEVFETMFKLPPGDDNAKEEIIYVPDVTVTEFEALLKFCYHGVHSLPNDSKFWSDLLSISTRFIFDTARDQAVQRLSELLNGNPVEKIYLASKFNINNWLREAYCDLCERSNPLEIPEAKRIGWETAILLAKAREIFLRSPQSPQVSAFGYSGFPSGSQSSQRSERVSSAVTQVFGKIDGEKNPVRHG